MIIPDAVRRALRGQPDRRPGDEPGRAAAAAAGVPRLRGDRGRADPVRRREHVDDRRQRRAEPRGRGRRAGGLVPQAAPAVRHHLPPHQPDRAPADGHHRRQPRRRLPARRGLRVRRGLELLPEGARRAGAALPAARPGVQDARSTCTSAGTELPIGLVVTTLVLFLVAIANLFSKQIATIYGIAFTVVLFIVFTVSERINSAGSTAAEAGPGGIQPGACSRRSTPETHARAAGLRAGGGARLPPACRTCRSVLEKTNLRRHDIVVMTVRPDHRRAPASTSWRRTRSSADYEKELFSRVVTMAEKEGKPVDLLVVPGVDPFDAMVQTAAKLKASRLVTGVSAQMDSEELARRIGLAWEQLPEPRHPFSLEVISPDRPSIYVNLGPHPPRLWPEDLDRLHDLWLALERARGIRLEAASPRRGRAGAAAAGTGTHGRRAAADYRGAEAGASDLRAAARTAAVARCRCLFAGAGFGFLGCGGGLFFRGCRIDG